MSFLNKSLASRLGSVRGRLLRRSLAEQLVVTHVGLSTLLVLNFGVAMYWLSRQAMYREAEADLLAAAQLLAQDLAATDGSDSPRVAETYFHRFGPAPRDRAYFVAWDAGGRRIAGSEILPAQAVLVSPSPPTHGPRPFTSHAYGSNLDLVIALPHGGQLLLGRPLAKEFDGLRRLLWRMILGGLVCAALGFAAARWIARRVTEPLERMTTTAEAITNRAPMRRLDVGEASPEIQRLAQVFNAMLDRLQGEFEKQTRFTADAAHELRTPLAIVLSQAEHTLTRERQADDYRRSLETCRKAALRMRKLVNDLLLLARADAGCLPLRREPFDLDVLTRETVESLQPLADAQRVRMEIRTAPTRIVGDASRLAQVVANLATNAIRYNVADGTVVVEVRRDDATALLIVRDTGIGILPADQPHLFERFYRVDRVRTHGDDVGTGLGLSLVAEIVAAHGGTIHVDSVLGTGTTMTVRLPIEVRPTSTS